MSSQRTTVQSVRPPWKRQLTRFLSAQTLSLFGSSLAQYAIIWHITLSTSSGKLLTVSTLCGFLPQIFISLFAGVWLDRYNRKHLIQISDALIAASTLVLALTFFLGEGQLWLLFLVLIVRSAGTGIQTPAVNSLLPELVPADQLMRVNGLNSTLSSLMMFLSPALGGALLSIAPLEYALFIDVLTAVLGIALTATVRIAAPVRNAGVQSQGKELRAGLALLKKMPFLGRMLVFQFVVLFLISPSAFLTPLMVSRSFGPEVWRLTLSELTYSLGMVLGGLLVCSWGGFHTRMHTTLFAGAAYGVLMLGLGLTPFGLTGLFAFSLYLGLNTLIGLTSPLYQTPMTVTIQERVDPAMHGRMFSLMQITTSCALPLGMALFGPLADRVPVQWLLRIAGGLVVVLVLLVWRMRLLEDKAGA